MNQRKEEKAQSLELDPIWQGTGLEKAIQADDIETIEAIFQDPKKIQQLNICDDGLSPLMLAAYLSRIEIVKYLLSLAADPYVMNKQKQTASRLIIDIEKERTPGFIQIPLWFAQVCVLLSEAEEKKMRKMRAAIDESNLEAVKACFPNGEQTDLVCAQIAKGYTPLQYAAIIKGNPEIVDYLLSMTGDLRSLPRNDPALLIKSIKLAVPKWEQQENYRRVIHSLEKAVVMRSVKQDAKAFISQLKERQEALLNIKKRNFDDLPYNENEQNLINMEANLFNFTEENKKLAFLEQCGGGSQETLEMSQQNKDAIKEVQLKIEELQNKIQASEKEAKERKVVGEIEPVSPTLRLESKSWWESPLSITHHRSKESPDLSGPVFQPDILTPQKV